MQSILLDLQKEVKKTIVFITHDLDEALRLGDRIAILRDGEVIQQGTGQEIVLKPADDYIMSFVQHVNRGKVVQIETIMEPGHSDQADSIDLPYGTVLEKAVSALLSSGKQTVLVTDAMGTKLGSVSLQKLITAMVAA
jgi:glycine betaine/proline transport system ATP-binding protein